MAKKISEVTARYIFETMEYGTVNENIDLAETWFKKTDIKLKSTPDDIEIIIQKHEQQSQIWKNTSAPTKAKLLNKLASEIEKYSSLLCQIELKSRNILTKDTKNISIQIFVDYLKYYAGWVYTVEKYFPNCKPYGVCASYLSDDTPLSIFAAILAPALASGNTIIFGVSSRFIPVACFISELCKNIGFPEGTITFIETSTPKIFLSHERIKKITYVGNLYNKQFSEISLNKEKNIASLHLGKGTSIVFDSADLDSACDSIICNSWGYDGKFPCGINQIFIQENIYADFVDRLKSRIEKLNVSNNNKIADKTCDIFINKQTFNKNDMIDVINKLPLQLGHKHFGNNIIFEESTNQGDVLSVLAFRTANEATQLVNNSKYGLACSVWTENISLANEITNKLKAGIIWINTHGNINANVSFSPYKGSGTGHFGGQDGLLEYLTNKNPVEYKSTPFKLPTIEADLPSNGNNQNLIYHSGGFKKSESNKKDVRNCVESAKKSYETWNKTEPKVRAQTLTKLAEMSALIKIKNSQITEKWVEYLHEWSSLTNNNETFTQSNPNLKVIKEALGVITIETYSDVNYSCLQLIAAAIAYGNAVVIVNCSEDLGDFLESLCKINTSSGIPSGIFNVFFNANTEIVDTLLNHREIQNYFASFQMKKDSKYNFTHISRLQNIDDVDYCSYKNVLKVVTKNKFIWSCVGESFL